MNETQTDRESTSQRTITFMGNTYDLAALVALIVGGVLLFLCLTCGMGSYCLPLVPIAAGVFALASVSRAADPERTRLYSWLGIGAGGFYLLLIVVLIALYVGGIVMAGVFAGQ